MLRYYILIIIASNVGIMGLNFLAYGNQISVLFAVLSPILATVAVILLDAIVAIITRALPKDWLSPFGSAFSVSKKERKFLDKLKVKAWKDKIPEMGRFLCNFDKTKVKDNPTSDYVLTFLHETTMAEAMHFMSIFAGFLLLLIPIPNVQISILFVVLVNALLQIPPVLVQRYNRPKLMAYYTRLKRKENKSPFLS